MYLDATNLYDSAMSQYLPYGGYKWIKNTDSFDEKPVYENSPIGFLLNMDL